MMYDIGYNHFLFLFRIFFDGIVYNFLSMVSSSGGRSSSISSTIYLIWERGSSSDLRLP